MDIGGWLRSLGLERYEAAFRENEIDDKVLPSLTAEDLKDLGVGIVGHRRKLLDAIAVLGAYASAKAPTAEAPPTLPKPAQDTAERRQVTVMFSDLVGSTALSARMDPEDLREIISAYQKCVAETVRRFGGFVAKYMGDGVLVYFGYPQAHEDDAERAVRAGLELIRGVSGLKSKATLQTRVGIATGLVVVGDLIGVRCCSGASGFVGETPNLAARLQGHCRAEHSCDLGGHAKTTWPSLRAARPRGEGTQGHRRSRCRAYAGAASELSGESLRGVAHRVEHPLIGRDEEVDVLMRRWLQAKAGDGCVVLISGEPGIGKSRIAEATTRSALAAEPHTRLRFFCSPYHQDSALYPAIAQLERAAGFRRDDTAEQRLDKLEVVLLQGD